MKRYPSGSPTTSPTYGVRQSYTLLISKLITHHNYTKLTCYALRYIVDSRDALIVPYYIILWLTTEKFSNLWNLNLYTKSYFGRKKQCSSFRSISLDYWLFLPLLY